MADSSDYDVTTRGKEIIVAPVDKPAGVPSPIKWPGIVMFFIAPVYFAVTLFAFTKAIGNTRPYWAVEWFLVIFVGMILQSLLVSWEDTKVTVDKVSKGNRLAGWLKDYLLMLSRRPMAEIAAGLLVTYGLFLVMEFFDVVHVGKHEAIYSLDKDNLNLVRLLFSTTHLPLAFYIAALIVLFAILILLPIMRWRAGQPATDLPALFAKIDIDKVSPEDIQRIPVDVETAPRDCGLIQERIENKERQVEELRNERRILAAEQKELLDTRTGIETTHQKLQTEKAGLEQAQAYFRAHPDGFIQEAEYLDGQNFELTESEDLRATSIATLRSSAANFLALATEYAAKIKAADGMLAANGETLDLINARLQVVSERLAAIAILLGNLEHQLELLRSLYDHCMIPPPPESVYVVLPRFNINYRVEQLSGGGTAQLAAVFIFAYLAANTLIIAPELKRFDESKAIGIDGFGWLAFGLFLVVLSVVPTLALIRGIVVPRTTPAEDDNSTRNRKNLSALGCFAAGGLGFLVSMAILLPDPRSLPAVNAHVLALQCGQPTKKSVKSIFNIWKFAKDNKVSETGIDTCSLAEPLSDSTNYIISVGLASQEGDVATQTGLAQQRAQNLLNQIRLSGLSNSAGQGTCQTVNTYTLVMGEAEFEAELATPVDTNHDNTGIQRPVIMLGGLVPMTPKSAKPSHDALQTIATRYDWAWKHVQAMLGMKPALFEQAECSTECQKKQREQALAALGDLGIKPVAGTNPQLVPNGDMCFKSPISETAQSASSESDHSYTSSSSKP